MIQIPLAHQPITDAWTVPEHQQLLWPSRLSLKGFFFFSCFFFPPRDSVQLEYLFDQFSSAVLDLSPPGSLCLPFTCLEGLYKKLRK